MPMKLQAEIWTEINSLYVGMTCKHNKKNVWSMVFRLIPAKTVEAGDYGTFSYDEPDLTLQNKIHDFQESQMYHV